VDLLRPKGRSPPLWKNGDTASRAEIEPFGLNRHNGQTTRPTRATLPGRTLRVMNGAPVGWLMAPMRPTPRTRSRTSCTARSGTSGPPAGAWASTRSWSRGNEYRHGHWRPEASYASSRTSADQGDSGMGPVGSCPPRIEGRCPRGRGVQVPRGRTPTQGLPTQEGSARIARRVPRCLYGPRQWRGTWMAGADRYCDDFCSNMMLSDGMSRTRTSSDIPKRQAGSEVQTAAASPLARLSAGG
jgi:hypothetical protein